jgi:ABC-2 type transport system ATP-binding protein
VITAQALARTFRTRSRPVEAVAGVDLEVAPEEIVGFLGPNGAGKTTTIRMLTTLLVPTAGRATVAGHDLRGDPAGVRRRIGYVAQRGVTLPQARAGEEAVDQARLFGLTRAEATSRSRELFARLDLDGLENRPCAALSGGQRRRLDIALGLVHSPELIFLDEPTTGLDPQSRANLWQHIRDLRADAGTTVFLTTHYLDEADALCDRIFVMDQGTIVAWGTPDELKRQVSGDVVELVLTRDDDVAKALETVKALRGVGDVSADRGSGRCGIHVQVRDGSSALPALLHDLDDRNVGLEAVQVHRPTLDDVFLSLTGRSLRDAPAA